VSSGNPRSQPAVFWLRSVSCPLGWASVAVAGAALGLGLSRALAEGLSSHCGWLAALPGTLLVTAAVVALVLAVWRQIGRREEGKLPATTFAPLFLSLGYLLPDEVNPLRAAVWLLGSLLLTGVSLAMALRISSSGDETRGWGWSVPVALLVAAAMGVYLATLGRTVGKADTFEFQVVAHNLGIAHPTGYPLYVLLGKLFTLLPLGSIALRVNLLSAVSATGATALVYAILRRLSSAHLADGDWGLPLLGALAFAFSPTLWSQAVEAEVYALNSLLVALVLWFLLAPGRARRSGGWVPPLFLAFGLGMANHVTTVILLPAVAVALFLSRPQPGGRAWLAAAVLLGLGLAVYLYLPLRWPAVHEGALMTPREFIEWVTGSRFKGALQLDAWRTDPMRYGILGRLVLDQWGWPGVILAGIGLFWLARRHWRAALISLITWLGYALYALSYYVPDVSVFLIPAHLVQAIWMSLGVMVLAQLLSRLLEGRAVAGVGHAAPVVLALFALLPLSLLTHHWSGVDCSDPNPLEEWGRQVLAMDLESDAAILADSEKIAPLYYLQQTEGVRPDLDIVVLPDEAAYRGELDARVAAGQVVYLARFLPHLQGVYHLRSAGPLTEVSPYPLLDLPTLDGRLDAHFGPHVTLLGYRMDRAEVAYPDTVSVTLYWTADAPIGGVYHIRLRLVDDDSRVVWAADGAHPVDNTYPTSAWRPGEIVPDAHQIPWPLGLAPSEYRLEVALLVPFGDTGLTPAGGTDPWLPLATLAGRAPWEVPDPAVARRIWTGEGVITGLNLPAGVRPGAVFPVVLFLENAGPTARRVPVEIGWGGGAMLPVDLSAPVTGLTLPAPAENGEHTLVVTAREPMRCGWLARPALSCPLAEVSVLGAPLPAGAINFQDLVALRATQVASYTLRPGGTLEVTLTWQALAPIEDDYTVFLHVLDPADRIVGQVDAWPVQGTYPTSQWPVGEIITDPYRIRIASDAAPGAYRLEVGWYLLGTMRRLNVLSAEGEAVEDRVLMEGFVVR
jgi:hypothetical protein